MVRTPCCDQMGLNKGPWTAEEDKVLVAYVQNHGHGNWRALPKKAGLLRCGKSCRLRWINYLRPDIKRGNFTADEEETIVRLHQQLGNRWSTIAAQLPGRTDNEIKNVWHTHLKTHLLGGATAHASKPQNSALFRPTPVPIGSFAANLTLIERQPAGGHLLTCTTMDSKPASSSSWTTGNDSSCIDELEDFSSLTLPELDDSFWADMKLPAQVQNHPASDYGIAVAGAWPATTGPRNDALLATSQSLFSDDVEKDGEDEIHFWLRVLKEAGDLPGF